MCSNVPWQFLHVEFLFSLLDTLEQPGFNVGHGDVVFFLSYGGGRGGA